jgi:predicted signal transduction protein with EAL and GGDEF domain
VATRLQDALHATTGTELVTASLGVSTWLGPEDRREEILRRADEALYTAKRGGRDRAAIWEPDLAEAQVGLHWLGRRPRHPAPATRV